jgi:hypothetical protein
MMFHPALDRLRAFADGELSAAGRTRAAAHLEECLRCRSKVSWLRDTREQAQQATELTPPPQAWAAIAQRIQNNEIVLAPAGAAHVAETGGLRRTAVIVLALLTAGTAVAALGARQQLRNFLSTLRGPAPAATTPATTPRSDSASSAAVMEIVVPAEDGAVVIHIDAPRAGLRLRVRMSESAEVGIRATAAAAAAQFRSGPGRNVIARAGGGEVTIDVPRGLHTARIDVDGLTWVEKQSGSFRINAPVVDTVGAEFLIPVR